MLNSLVKKGIIEVFDKDIDGKSTRCLQIKQ